MDARLKKQWEVTRSLLSEAAVQVSSMPGFSSFGEYIEHNELELALNVLEQLGEQSTVNAGYWQNLYKASEVMGLQTHYGDLRQKAHKARRAS